MFKIERGDAGEKVAYVRMFSGTVRTRDRLRFGDDLDGKVTGISVFDRGPAVRGRCRAGEIGMLRGLADVQVGDRVGQRGPAEAAVRAAPLEAVVVASPADRGRLHVALSQLAEQDPLINLRQDDILDEVSVSLFGEVQKEVIQATLADEFGIAVTFSESTTICIERVKGTGEASEILHAPGNPFLGTAGLRIDPAPPGSGVRFRLDVDVRSIPLFVYKTAEAFSQAMTQYVRQSLREGLHGWEVTDCVVTMTDCGYTSPGTSAADFRKLTPLVLMTALQQASTVVCEPMLGSASRCRRLGRGSPGRPDQARRGWYRAGSAQASSPSSGPRCPRRRQALQRQLPGLSSGEGVIETGFGGTGRCRDRRPAAAARPRTR